MTFILGAVLFLLGGFFGMLIMAFGQSINRLDPPPANHPVLKAVRDDKS
jgi:hypothetical protein